MGPPVRLRRIPEKRKYPVARTLVTEMLLLLGQLGDIYA